MIHILIPSGRSIITGNDVEHAINFTNVDQSLFESCVTFADGQKKNCSLDDESREKTEGDAYSKPSVQIFIDTVTNDHRTEKSVYMLWLQGKLIVEEYDPVPFDENS
ncbi:unnamed protein product [Rotaria sordida]|uniref:Uncharacterized protein n=1 Tax=Rotaria sordida TaxID=392033 RepID=A0A819HL69_9BILA|nr:unnamed protein product [Rotaria sordida]CAF3901814.1 unnamed protein product [Rotaria sordida]